MGTPGREPIVIIDDDKSICKTLKLHFERNGYDVTIAHLAREGIAALRALHSAIVILDIKLPDANGVDLLKDIRTYGENYYSIIITAFPDMESTVKAVQAGVGEYIYKPIDIQELDDAVAKGNDFLLKVESRDIPYIPIPKLATAGNHFIGKSQIMKEVFKTVGLVSMSKTTVHITGESGTGKELIAKAIHQNSPDGAEPCVSVNCSAIVETLLESELFGHEKGAFTGAIIRKEGKFSLARNGTIFLDEIGDMDINIQAKLLRVLQEREFEMVGGKEKLKANCRVISATNRDLKQMVKDGQFREDLFYRLNVVSIYLPPLRERKVDIPEFALYFTAKTCKEISKDIHYISQEAIDFLMEQSWTGNVRQLENVITNAVIMSRNNRLSKEDFTAILKPEDFSAPSPSEPPSWSEAGAVLASSQDSSYKPRSLQDMEKEQIHMALAYTKWHKGKACDILGITRPRLERKIDKYGLKPLKLYYGK